MQTLPSQNLSVLSLGGIGANAPSLIIPESNSQPYFTIYAGGVPGANQCTPFVKNGVLYQVTAGKTFKSVAMVWWSSAANGALQLLSATATFNDGVAVGTLTGPVYQGGASTKYTLAALTAYAYYNASITYDFAATTWPGIQFNTGSSALVSCWIVGKEV